MPTPLIQKLINTSAADQATYTDAVSRIRVCEPESLIDTDFEYGLQNVKWETIQLVNNIPTFFTRVGDATIPLAAVTGYGTEYVLVTTASAHNLSEGAPFYIVGLRAPVAEGFFNVVKVVNSTSFTYRAKSTVTNGSIFDANASLLYPSQMYAGTAFTSDQIQYITTDSNVYSTLNVVTNTISGFTSNTNFALTNSVGKRQLTFFGNNVTGGSSDTITITNHNLSQNTEFVYSNVSGSENIGLVSGTTYYVAASGYSVNAFRVTTTSGGGHINLTAGTAGSTHTLITSGDASDDIYNTLVSSEASSFQLFSSNQILPTILTFNPSNVVNQGANTLIFPRPHSQATGNPVIYNANGNTPIGGLSSGTTYWAIRRDMNTLGIATTRNTAIAGTPVVTFGNVGFGTTHELICPCVNGEQYTNGTITLYNGCNVAFGSNLNFFNITRANNRFRVETNWATNPVQYSVNVGVGTNLYLNTNTNIAAATPVRFVGNAGTSSLINSNIYYVRTVNATLSNYSLFNNATDSAAASAVVVGNVGAGNVVTLSNRAVFDSTVTDVMSSTRLRLGTAAAAVNAGSNFQPIIQTSVFPYMDGYIYHRSHDGGIELIPSNNSDGQIIRQTRKYFRYQPGKGIQLSMSINFSAPLELDNLTYSSGTVTGTTKKPHRLTPGLSVTIEGALGTNWNRTVTIATVPTATTFTYVNGAVASPTTVTGYPTLRVNGWTGSRIRGGLYDDQNGMFFEYDGSQIYAVRRDSVTQLSGSHSVTLNSATVLGTGTKYLTQLADGDYVSIKGMTYKVVNIVNNTTLYIMPPYRGPTDAYIPLISKVIDTRTPQSEWNIDKCDGTGASGYVLNVGKIQMIYMDYSWYGAGKIRFGFKDTDGIVRYVHEYKHNNTFNTAYFRSGNLPARYEVQNIGYPTWVPPLLHWGTAVIMDGKYDDDKAYLFTAPANVLSFTNGDTVAISAATSNINLYNIYDPYTQRNTTAYGVITDGVTSTYASLQNIKPNTLLSGPYVPANTLTIGTPQKYSTSTNQALIYINKVPTINNAYSAYTLGYIYDTIPALIPLVSIRLAPSVDSSLTAALGVRELINRMQLRMRSVDVLTTNDTEIRLILNGTIDNKAWVAATNPSLSQYVAHNKFDTVEGGITIFSFRVPGGSIDSSGKISTNVVSYDISQLGSLGNSIMGGDFAYPDGPDQLTLAAVCLDSGGTTATTPYVVSARITWAENQS